eukprot:TRINITY_DN82703_c0_g1_i1.p1 TRINITY_DN82703_c0_g1~~TRINITY_DN82703_c0_g1_i1.p1  ORF type:complete len:229 (+),score=45.17 TRINITY_DN82703_c0_g1_i1:40-726(+)
MAWRLLLLTALCTARQPIGGEGGEGELHGFPNSTHMADGIVGLVTEGCVMCCKTRDCGTAYAGRSPGTCCNTHPPMCCPSGTRCFPPNQCQRLQSYQRDYGYSDGFHNDSGASMVGFFVGAMLLCGLCFCLNQVAKSASAGGGHGYSPVATGMPVYGGYGGPDPLLAGGGGFLGGLLVGEMLSGPDTIAVPMDTGFGGNDFFPADGGGGWGGDGAADVFIADGGGDGF